MEGALIATFGDVLTVDLIAQTVNGFGFLIAESDKHMLINGLDPIALTLEDEAEISAYLQQDKINRPWAY